MSNAFEKYLIGDTAKFTWINSGVSMAPTMEVFSGSETIVSTGTFVDSGLGHYYYLHTVSSEGYYRMKATGTANGKPYVRSQKIKGVTGAVD